MTIIINDDVLATIIGGIRSVLFHHIEGIDTAFNESVEDQGHIQKGLRKPKNLSISLNIGLTEQRDKIRAAVTIAYTPKKIKEKIEFVIDPHQLPLPTISVDRADEKPE